VGSPDFRIHALNPSAKKNRIAITGLKISMLESK